MGNLSNVRIQDNQRQHVKIAPSPASHCIEHYHPSNPESTHSQNKYNKILSMVLNIYHNCKQQQQQ